MARESWLRSADHGRFADAMMKCRHPAAFCAQDGRCLFGDCFRRPRGDTALVRLEALEKAVGEIVARLAALR